MANFHVPFFEGLTPKKEPLLLKDTEATTCENARLDRGHLEPWKGLKAESTLGSTGTGAKTIFKYGSQWLHWSNTVDVVKTPVVADAYDQIYFTGDGNPKYTYQGRPSVAGAANGFQLGIPAPSATVSAVPALTTGTFEEDRYYVFTYVSPLGEEGPPSSPSTKITVADNAAVAITFTTEAIGSYNLGTGAFRRLYRTGTGTTSTEYQFVADIAIGTLTYSDTKLLEALGEVLPSITWDPPPHSGTVGLGPLQGITTLTNGFLAGFVGNTLCFSEQFIPSAWPSPYRMSFDSDIVGLGVAGNSVIVLTETYPYMVSGSSPIEMGAVRIESAQACVNKASIVDGGEYLIYASPDGLMGVSEAGVKNLTEAILTRSQWETYSPDTLVGLYYEDMYLGVSSTGAFFIDRAGTLTDLTGLAIVSGVNDLLQDKLYILLSGGVIKSFNEGTALSAKWKSKTFRSSRPSSIGMCELEVDGATTFKLYGNNGALKHTQSFTTGIHKFRTPSGELSNDWAFEVSGTGTVKYVTLASTTMELVSG